MLYQPERHIAVTKTWDPELATICLQAVLEDVRSAYDQSVFWPKGDGWDESETATSLYLGAMGVLWSLDHLKQYIDGPLPFDTVALANAIHEKYFESEALAFPDQIDANGAVASYFLGETGVLLVQSALAPEHADAIWQRQFELISNNIRNPTLEPLWGGTGSVIPVLFKLEAGVTDDWLSLFHAHAEYLRGVMDRDSMGYPVWIQDLYGAKRKLSGAGHGFVGNMYPFLRGAAFLTDELRDWARQDTVTTVIRSAVVEGDCCNWPSSFEGEDRARPPFLVQWCHGAPGVIISVNDVPVGYSDEFDELMVKGAETIWQAGPLKKGAGLCHGTDGNGFALLKMYRRTFDPLWLDRARCFAMHAIEQVGQNYSLWEGDLGAACFIHACLVEDDRFPLLDIC